MPTKSDVAGINSKLANKILINIKIQKRRGFAATFPTASKEALDLLRRLLVFNPTKRLSV